MRQVHQELMFVAAELAIAVLVECGWAFTPRQTAAGDDDAWSRERRGEKKLTTTETQLRMLETN